MENQNVLMPYQVTCTLYFGNGVNDVAFGAPATIALAAAASKTPTGTVTLTSTFDSVQAGYQLWAQCSGGDPGYVFMTYATISAISLNALN